MKNFLATYTLFSELVSVTGYSIAKQNPSVMGLE